MSFVFNIAIKKHLVVLLTTITCNFTINMCDSGSKKSLEQSLALVLCGGFVFMCTVCQVCVSSQMQPLFDSCTVNKNLCQVVFTGMSSRIIKNKVSSLKNLLFFFHNPAAELCTNLIGITTLRLRTTPLEFLLLKNRTNKEKIPK